MKLYFTNKIEFSYTGRFPCGLVDMLEKNGYRLVKREHLSFNEMTIEYTDHYVFEKLEHEIDNVENIVKQIGIEEEMKREMDHNRLLDNLITL